MTTTKRVRWECPHGLHPAVLGSTRPAKNATARFCLPCSLDAGVLVERTAPTLERRRATRTAAVAAKRERKNQREREAKTNALIVPVVDRDGNEFTLDAGALLREAWRTNELRSRQRDSFTGKRAPTEPTLVIRRGAKGNGRDNAYRQDWIASEQSRSRPIRLRDKLSGHAMYDGSKIVLTVRPGLGHEWLRAVIIHEAAHGACSIGAHHGSEWRTAYVRTVREVYGVNVPNEGANWQLDEAIAEAILESMAR